MALFRSIGARKDSTRGTSALEVRKGFANLFTGPGVLPGGASPLVTGNSDWTYTVGAAGFVTRRSTADGVHLFGNDGPVPVSTSPAPGTGSRTDIIWVRHRSAGENTAVTSEPDFGVTTSLPEGALELARKVVAAGDANTADGAAIQQTAARAYLANTAPRHAELTGATMPRTVPSGAAWGMGTQSVDTSRSVNAPVVASGESFTMSATGVYVVSAFVQFQSVLSGRALVSIAVDGADVARSVLTGDDRASVAANLYLTAGQTVTVSLFQSSGSDQSLIAQRTRVTLVGGV